MQPTTIRLPRGSKLEGLFRGLEALYQTRTGLDPKDLLLPYRKETASSTRELLLFRETEDGDLEVALALDVETLRRLETLSVEQALSDEGLGHTLPVIEGLSHLVYIAEAARRQRPISGLELETQAEVDKLAICLLHRWPRARNDFERLVDRLYYRFSWSEQGDEKRERYDQANRLALAFSKQLRPHVDAKQLSDLRQTLRRFWAASMQDKRALAGQ